MDQVWVLHGLVVTSGVMVWCISRGVRIGWAMAIGMAANIASFVTLQVIFAAVR